MAKNDTSKKQLDTRMKRIALILERMRKEKGYRSYESFAIDKGLGRMQYWRMEKGTNFQFESLLKILDAHEVNLADFFADFTEVGEPRRNDL